MEKFAEKSRKCLKSKSCFSTSKEGGQGNINQGKNCTFFKHPGDHLWFGRSGLLFGCERRMVYQLKLPQRLAFLFQGHLHQKTNGKAGTNVETQTKEVKLQRILLKKHDTNCPHFCWRSVCFLLQFHYNVLMQNRVHREAPFRKLQGIRSILGFEVWRVDSGAKDRFNSDCSCQGTVFEDQTQVP